MILAHVNLILKQPAHVDQLFPKTLTSGHFLFFPTCPQKTTYRVCGKHSWMPTIEEWRKSLCCSSLHLCLAAPKVDFSGNFLGLNLQQEAHKISS